MNRKSADKKHFKCTEDNGLWNGTRNPKLDSVPNELNSLQLSGKAYAISFFE